MDRANLNYDELSDTDLIRRFGGDPPDQYAFEVLWKRNEPALRRYVRSAMKLCPDFYSREIFEEDVFDQTQENVARHIGSFQAMAKFSTWLYRIVLNTAMSHRRHLRGRSKKGPRKFIVPTEDELFDSNALSRDKVKHDPLRAALTEELKTSMKGVLKNYVRTQKGYDSYRVVFYYSVEDLSPSDIAKRFRTYERKIYRMLKHDYKALKALFTHAGTRALLED